MKLLPLYRDVKDLLTKELISQCLRGSAEAQRELFDIYYTPGMNIALRYSSNSEDAKEILSNAFIRVYKKLQHFDVDKAFLPWFNKIIVHASSDYYRYHHQETISLNKLPDVGFDAEIIDLLSYQELLVLIQKLPYTMRSVFNLYVVEGFKHKEIALILGISEGTSKSNLSRARNKLQLMISDFSKLKDSGPFRQENKKQVIKGS